MYKFILILPFIFTINLCMAKGLGDHVIHDGIAASQDTSAPRRTVQQVAESLDARLNRLQTGATKRLSNQLVGDLTDFLLLHSPMEGRGRNDISIDSKKKVLNILSNHYDELPVDHKKALNKVLTKVLQDSNNIELMDLMKTKGNDKKIKKMMDLSRIHSTHNEIRPFYEEVMKKREALINKMRKSKMSLGTKTSDYKLKEVGGVTGREMHSENPKTISKVNKAIYLNDMQMDNKINKEVREFVNQTLHKNRDPVYYEKKILNIICPL